MENLINPTIAIVDSGIGGVSILNQLLTKYNAGNYIYFADNLYMPYGNKSYSWLSERVAFITNLLIEKYNSDMVIIACNTASTVSKQKSNIITMQFKKNYLYLATTLTKRNLPEINIISDSNLATEIEKNILNKQKMKKLIKCHIKRKHLNEYNEIVLGCTHYELVAQIFKELCPNTTFINNSSFVIDNLHIPFKAKETNVVIKLTKQDLELENKIKLLINRYENVE